MDAGDSGLTEQSICAFAIVRYDEIVEHSATIYFPLGGESEKGDGGEMKFLTGLNKE